MYLSERENCIVWFWFMVHGSEIQEDIEHECESKGMEQQLVLDPGSEIQDNMQSILKGKTEQFGSGSWFRDSGRYRA